MKTTNVNDARRLPTLGPEFRRQPWSGLRRSQFQRRFLLSRKLTARETEKRRKETTRGEESWNQRRLNVWNTLEGECWIKMSRDPSSVFKEIDRHGTWNNKLSLRQIVSWRVPSCREFKGKWISTLITIRRNNCRRSTRNRISMKNK